jgi:hypothetical protein
MRKKIFLFLAPILLALSSCADNAAFHIFAPKPNGVVGDSKTLDASLNEAIPHYQAIKANYPAVLSELYDVTPSFLKSVCQLYRFSESCESLGSLEGSSLILYKEKAYPIGVSFGGYGVTHYAYGESQGKTLLYFIYSCGSGVHRSLVNAFDFSSCATESVEEKDKAFWNDDLQFTLSEEGKLEVRYSTYDVKGEEGFDITMNPGEVVYDDLTQVALVS